MALIHGWGAETQKLKPLTIELHKLGWKTYLVKLPGFELPSPDNPWKLADYVDWLKSDLQNRYKSENYFLFGHSFGGRILMKYVLVNRKKVNGIILCAASGISRGNPIKRFVLMCFAKLGKPFRTQAKKSSFWRKLLYKIAREHDYEKTTGVMRETFKNIISENLKTKVSYIKVPTLILWGKMDKMTSYSDALFLAKNISKSKLVGFDGVGHKLPYLEPNKLATEIEKWYREIL